MIERDSTMGIASYWLSALRILRGTTLTFPWIIHLFITDVAISLLLPISFLFPTVSYNLSSSLAFLVWSGIQNIFRFNGGHITVSGAELPRNESAIVVANHVAWTDFYLIQHLAIRAGMLSRQRYFAKQQLRYVPFLGWGLWAMGMPLVSREWVKDKSEMNRVFNGIIKNQWPICIFFIPVTNLETDFIQG
jgi:1-acyl-sn-glycerol-3-phosphate acyltransferase